MENKVISERFLNSLKVCFANLQKMLDKFFSRFLVFPKKMTSWIKFAHKSSTEIMRDLQVII